MEFAIQELKKDTQQCMPNSSKNPKAALVGLNQVYPSDTGIDCTNRSDKSPKSDPIETLDNQPGRLLSLHGIMNLVA